MRKKFLFVFLAVFFVLICGVKVQNTAYARESGQLVVVSPWKAASLDPVSSGFVFTRMGCLETLVNSDRRGGIEPGLAEKWEISEDGLEWTFFLRENVSFHDGSVFTPEAASTALNHALEQGAFQGVGIEWIKAGKENTLLIKTQSPFSALPSFLAHYSAAIGAPAIYDNGFEQVAGTGMYKFSSRRGFTHFEFEAFEDYWGDKALIQSTVYLAVANPETRALMAESGEAHIVVTVSPQAASRLADHPRVEIHSAALPRVRLIKLNTALPLFEDENIRRALSMAIDRQGIAAALLNNVDTAATQLLPPASAWHDRNLDGFEHFRHDPEQAEKILNEFGWNKGRDGILERDGKRFSFEIFTYAARPALPVIAEAVQAQLRDVGIEAKITVAEAGMIPDRHSNNTLESALLARNFGQIPDAVATIMTDFGPAEERGGWGAMNWNSDKLNLLLQQYMHTFDDHARNEMGLEIVRVLNEEMPVIPVAWYDNHVAVSTQIGGFEQDPFELRSYAEGVFFTR